MTRLESRSWSCSELVRGAAAVVDMGDDAAVVKQEEELLRVTDGMSVADIRKLLEARSSVLQKMACQDTNKELEDAAEVDPTLVDRTVPSSAVYGTSIGNYMHLLRKCGL